MLNIIDVCKHFHDLPVLSHLSLRVASQEIVALVGPSGCGKSTLLNLIAGLNADYTGKIENHSIAIGYVFQEDRILPWLTVYDNIRVVREKEDPNRIQELINKMKLTGFEHYYPNQLSGGMRQRCGIARAFYYGSDLLLMDEPFKSLDHSLRLEMLCQLAELWESENTAVLFVTHDIDEALMLAQRILVLSPRPATLIQEIKLPRTTGLRCINTPELLKVKNDLLSLSYN